MDLVLITSNGWCAIKPNQTEPNYLIVPADWTKEEEEEEEEEEEQQCFISLKEN